jgi:hypothetical protein
MSASSIAGSIDANVAPASLYRPLRNLFLAVTLTALALAAAGRLVGSVGYEMLIVAMGWPHVILGFIFYFGKVARGEKGARLACMWLVILTLLLWAAHYAFALTGLIYVYFLYHAFRDEIAIYLQTRAAHRGQDRALAAAGIGPLMLLLVVIPQPQDFRQDLRRVELTGAQLASSGWTLISFAPVAHSRGRDFYFFLQAPNTEGLRAFTTLARTFEARRDGEVRIADQRWALARDLVFVPHYTGDAPPVWSRENGAGGTIPVLLTGGHRVGQTFTADRNDLAGIWLPISRFEDDGRATRFVFRLASPPLLPLDATLSKARLALIVFLSGLAIWSLAPRLRRNAQLGCYLIIFAAIFIGLQATLKTVARAGFAAPMLFQFIVVFHYFSWYIFSFDKLRAKARAAPAALCFTNFYDRGLARLRSIKGFAAAVIALNLISAAGVVWYYRLGAPEIARYGFDYNCFLYFLIFHVTFSMKRKEGKDKDDKERRREDSGEVRKGDL